MWKALRTGVFTAAVLIPIQIFAGDQHGLNTLEHQPQKIAAMEANWETGANVPLVLFAIPDEAARENRFEIAIPNGASLILRPQRRRRRARPRTISPATIRRSLPCSGASASWSAPAC